VAASAPSGKAAAPGLFAGLAAGYERRAAVLSLGQDPRWKRFLVDRLPVGAGDHVLDVATGTAAVAAELVIRRGCRVTGIDQSPEMLAAGRRRLAERGLEDRVELVAGEAERLPFPDASFDGLTVTYLLRYVEDPAATLRELVRVLRPGATLAGLEFAVPARPAVRALWRCYTGLVLPAAGALAGPAWWRAGRFLHRSIPDFYARHPLPELLALHREAGLTGLRVRPLSLGGAVVIWGTRDREAGAASRPEPDQPTGFR
jgi:demethylmenaquinone methyltransferase/2-methoxy-6-polyprenyl-1,4-benzoquinol methylase